MGADLLQNGRGDGSPSRHQLRQGWRDTHQQPQNIGRLLFSFIYCIEATPQQIFGGSPAQMWTRDARTGRSRQTTRGGRGACRQGDSDMSGATHMKCSKPDMPADCVHSLHRDHTPASLLEVQPPNKRPKRSKLSNLGRLK